MHVQHVPRDCPWLSSSAWRARSPHPADCSGANDARQQAVDRDAVTVGDVAGHDMVVTIGGDGTALMAAMSIRGARLAAFAFRQPSEVMVAPAVSS